MRNRAVAAKKHACLAVSEGRGERDEDREKEGKRKKKKEKGKKRRFKTRGAGETIDRLQSDRKIVGLVLERTDRSWIRSPVSRSGNRHESCLPLAPRALLIKEAIHSQGNPGILLRYVRELASILLHCSAFA